MYVLDTYALVKIYDEDYQHLELLKDSAVTNITLAEFYDVLLKRFNEKTAEYWMKKLQSQGKEVGLNTLIEAMKYKRKKKVSFFDAVGYMHAQMNNLIFVTGDKAFANEKDVLFLK